MYFISSISSRLLCGSCYVGEMIAFIAAVLPVSLNMWRLLKNHGELGEMGGPRFPM